MAHLGVRPLPRDSLNPSPEHYEEVERLLSYLSFT